MYPFIAEITDFLDQLDVRYRLEQFSLKISSHKLILHFIPNLSIVNWGEGETKPLHCPDNNCINIWEDVYHQHPEVVCSRLMSLLGKSERIYARETNIVTLNQTELNDFLLNNHLNVPTKAKFKYGLQKDGELVAVISFSKSCPIQRDGVTYRSHELIRYCSKLDHTVTGGLSKLISHFVSQHKPEDIMTYVDKEWSGGVSYKKLGFELTDETAPQAFWVVKSTGERYYSMEEAGRYALASSDIQKVYNCGSLKYVKLYK